MFQLHKHFGHCNLFGCKLAALNWPCASNFSAQIGHGEVVGCLRNAHVSGRECHEHVRPTTGRLKINALRHQCCIVGHKHIFENQIARYRGAHAQWIPITFYRQARRCAGYGQIKRIASGQFGICFFLSAQHAKEICRIRQRCKDFFAIDFPTAFYLHGLRAKGLRARCRCAAFRKGLRIDGTVFDNTCKVRLLMHTVQSTLLGGHVQIFRQQTAPHHGAHMHVEGERRSATPTANLCGHHGIGGVICALAAMCFGHAKRQQPCGLHVFVVFKWKLSVAVQLRCTGCKFVLPQIMCQCHEVFLFFCERIVIATNRHIRL